MSLAKKSQYNPVEGISVSTEDLFNADTATPMPTPARPPADIPPQERVNISAPKSPKQDKSNLSGSMPEPAKADDCDFADDNDLASGQGQVVLQVGENEPEVMLFELPLVPGAEDQEELEPAEIIVDEEGDEIQVECDPWAWEIGKAVQWAMEKLKGIPTHSGRDTAGIERAIAYLKRFNGEISKIVQSDLDGSLDAKSIETLEKLREQAIKGIDRLEERLEQIMESKYSKKKKKSNADPEMVKEAQKAAKFTVVVPLFISSMARTCINSMVSAGKDIEDCFAQIVKTYDLTNREQAELMQLLADMGYPVRRPRGHLLDEEIDTSSEDNLDWSVQYPA